MSYALLERFLESEHFNRDPSLTIQYLARYADHVGIQYALCSKLRQFSYEELEFFLPQLCHLLISVDNESMALEEFILDLCEESVNSALLTFWLFQTYLYDLSKNPNTVQFRTCRRIFNKVQRIVFGIETKRERIKENVLPVTVLSSIVLASVAAPWLPIHAGPLAIAQARRPRPSEETISDGTIDAQSPTIRRSHTVGGDSPRRKRRDPSGRTQRPGSAGKTANSTTPAAATTDPETSSPLATRASKLTILEPQLNDATLSTSSLPLAETGSATADGPVAPSPPRSAGLPRPIDQIRRRLSHAVRPVTVSSLSRQQKAKMLRSNYFRSETAFLTALVDISNRLVAVPKPARPSALKAELALIAQDLPAEVDIPVICPASLVDGQPSKSRHHRIVRLNPAEATSLNSAERVPYLLLLEVLNEDFDFDADSEENSHLLARLLSEKGGSRQRRLFDITDASRLHPLESSLQGSGNDVNTSDTANGDIGSLSIPLTLDTGANGAGPRPTISPQNSGPIPKVATARSSSGATGRSSLTVVSTPRTSDGISRSGSPDPRRMTIHGTRVAEQQDVSALATHMRMAAQMLSQLEQSGSKRPKAEVLAIKNKIIASMQTLEEQSFLLDDPQNGPTFETMMAKAEAVAAADGVQGPEEALEEAAINPEAGAARMENDQKTGGVHRQGDRDDPSAANFGEEWAAKKERIRKTSPFGWMKNWDLISVIVKTGADLRQEAFACQLIQVCGRIWEAAEVPVWVKEMRILVTGESSGLIETITNGVSLHSIKRSLTMANIAATAALAAPATSTIKGARPPPRKAPGIATLRDHFIKAFGQPETPAHDAAVDAFARSLAAYSIISYVLQLKDRHNGNILIDNAGHIVHIDFGFMLSNSPGSMGFEAAPFKLTQEYIDVLGGTQTTPAFLEFRKLCKQAFQALRRNAENIIMLVDVMGRQSMMPCFKSSVETAVNALRSRFVLHLSKEEAEAYVDELIAKSAGSYYTRLYDTFQYRTQGIY